MRYFLIGYSYHTMGFAVLPLRNTGMAKDQTGLATIRCVWIMEG